MDSKTKSSSNHGLTTIINQYKYELELKQQTINQLENLCDKQSMQLEETIAQIEEKDIEIQNLLELLKFANPELFKVYKGVLTPY